MKWYQFHYRVEIRAWKRESEMWDSVYFLVFGESSPLNRFVWHADQNLSCRGISSLSSGLGHMSPIFWYSLFDILFFLILIWTQIVLTCTQSQAASSLTNDICKFRFLNSIVDKYPPHPKNEKKNVMRVIYWRHAN